MVRSSIRSNGTRRPLMDCSRSVRSKLVFVFVSVIRGPYYCEAAPLIIYTIVGTYLRGDLFLYRRQPDGHSHRPNKFGRSPLPEPQDRKRSAGTDNASCFQITARYGFDQYAEGLRNVKLRSVEQLALTWEPIRKTYTVTELNARLRSLLEGEFDDIWVAGEISGCKTASSGHCYFTLKDRDAQVRCVCFRNDLRYLKFKPQDGAAVMVRGQLDVFEARGEYQLLVKLIEPRGHGALQFAFEQLKKKLAAEGLFDAARKVPIPKVPRRIGIVTSPTGAVVQDILQILLRRFPGLHVRVYPALVQGEGSIETVCRAIEYFGRSGWAHVVIVARGGGSLEDLWTFNEESVARVIAACPVPLISAIGHETDFTISDFVADLRAPTPSAAAELVICTQQELLDQIRSSEHKLLQSIRYRLAMSARRLHERGVDRATTVLHRRIGRSLQRVDELEYAVRDRMRALIASRRRSLDERTARLEKLDLRLRFAHARRRLEAAESSTAQRIKLLLTRAHGRLDPLTAHLTQLSPLKILDRGYAIVTNENGHIVKEPAQAPTGSTIDVRVAQGRLRAEVK
jgi:exodeoxyribonuclease VII large subunit